MFDGLTLCEASSTVKLANGLKFHKDIYLPTSPRIRCDPLVYFNRAQNLCAQGRLNQAFLNIDLLLRTKHVGENELKIIVDIKDFCSQDIHYSLFSHNAWIHAK